MIQINTLKGFEDVQDFYYVQGDVIYSKKGNLKVLKPDKVNGYHGVRLQTKQNTTKGCLVHRIIATAYIPNPENKPTVNHINHIRTDNRVENLEWATREEQCNNIWREKHKSTLDKAHKARQKKVMLKDVENCRVIVFQSCQQCAEYLGVNKTVVSYAIKNGHKCKGYVLKEIEN